MNSSMKKEKKLKARPVWGGHIKQILKNKPSDARDELAQPRSVREKVRRDRSSRGQ